jgi:ribosomal protein S5
MAALRTILSEGGVSYVYMHTTRIRGMANLHCLLGVWRLVEVQKSGRTLFFALLALLGDRLGSLGWTLSIVFLCDSIWSTSHL